MARRFVYDGWLPILETVETVSGTVSNQYVWGKDLSGSFQGAGGVGGLLAVSLNGTWYFPFYDNNGNITAYIDESGAVVAEYAYDAFGELLDASGAMSAAFAFRFSTKYYDSETGLYYYGMRFYSPALHRWLNRDPIGQEAELNLYSSRFKGKWDYYDLADWMVRSYYAIMRFPGFWAQDSPAAVSVAVWWSW